MAKHPWMRILSLLGTLALAAGPLYAGTLRLGTPEVQNNQYTFPVYLQGNADGVAALDFRLAYDPAVFSPVSANSGRSAVQAQKQVSSNIAAPGEFVVVMMGFNQNAVQPGEVIAVVLEKIGEPAEGRSILRINEPTMATIDGTEIDSSGAARTVRFDSEKDGDDGAEPVDDRADNPNDGDTTDDVDLTGPDDAPAAPRFPFTVASMDTDTDRGRPDGAVAGTNSSGAAGGATGPQNNGPSVSAGANGVESEDSAPLSGPLADAGGGGGQNSNTPAGFRPVPESEGLLPAERGLVPTPAATLESSLPAGLDEKKESSRSSAALFGIVAACAVGIASRIVFTRRPRQRTHS